MKVKCERTGKLIEIKDGFFASPNHSGDWEFVDRDAPSHNDYNIKVSDLTQTPEALIDWLAHLNEKTWFDPKKFFDFIQDFRNRNGIFNHT